MHLKKLHTSHTIAKAQIPFKQSVKYLRLTTDSFFYEWQFSTILQICIFQLKIFISIRELWTNAPTETCIYCYFDIKFDIILIVFFNSLLLGFISDVILL